MKNNSISVLLNFMKEAGNIALESANQGTCFRKDDGSIVTNASEKISKMFLSIIEKNLRMGNTYIIDKDFSKSDEYLEENLENCDNIYMINPIDGTEAYFYGGNTFCITVSAIIRSIPVISMIYLPTAKELIYNTLKRSFYLKNAFSTEEKVRNLYYQDKKRKYNNIIHVPMEMLPLLKDSEYSYIDNKSNNFHAFNVIIERAKAAFFPKGSHIWDIYPAMSIAKVIGYKYYDINTEQEIDNLDLNLFDNNALKSEILLTHPNYYKEIKELFIK